MAVYKVPQNVEAEDKLVGPLTAKQLLFVGIAVGFGALSWQLAKISIVPAAIPAIPTAFFLILGLWPTSYQPIEVRMAAFVRFYFKNHTRTWQQTGIVDRIVIQAPKKIARVRDDGRSEEEVESRLKNLATILDTQGWAGKDKGSAVEPAPADDIYSPANPETQQLQEQLNEMKEAETRYLNNLVSGQPQANPVANPYDPASSDKYYSQTTAKTPDTALQTASATQISPAQTTPNRPQPSSAGSPSPSAPAAAQQNQAAVTDQPPQITEVSPEVKAELAASNDVPISVIAQRLQPKNDDPATEPPTEFRVNHRRRPRNGPGGGS